MQRLTAHLKRRNNKLIEEQQLSLPKIIKGPISKTTKTILNKSQIPIIKYISQTTYYLDQQGIPFRKPKQYQNHVNASHLEHRAKKDKSISISKSINQKLVLRCKKEEKFNRKASKLRSTALNSCKLQLILQDKGSFVKQYFEDIYSCNNI